MKRRADSAARAIARGDTVAVKKLAGSPFAVTLCRVVLVQDGEALLSREEEVSDEENAARKAKGLAPLSARTRYEVAKLDACVRH